MANDKTETSAKYLRVFDSKKHILVSNFLGGISWALGTIVGFLLISIISVYIIGQTGLLSRVSLWLSDIVQNSQNSLIPTDFEQPSNNGRQTK